MNGRSSHIAALLVLVVAGLPGIEKVRAQASPDLLFEHFDSRAGLSHNSVYTTYQDRQGFLWIGTNDGLNRFDGYDFVIYRHSAGDSTSLSISQVQAVQEGREGSVWVGTESTLERLDQMAGRFRRHLSEGISDLVLDREETLWAATTSGRVLRHDAEADRFIAYHTYDERWAFFRPLATDSTGTPWIFGREVRRDEPRVVLRRYDRVHDWFEEVLSLKPSDGKRPPQIHIGPSGTIWLAGIDSPTAALEEPGIRLVPSLPAGTLINYFVEDSGGILWIGTDGDGLYRYDPNADGIRQHRLEARAASWLNNNVQHLSVDRTGALWIATLGGLYRLDPHRKPFRHVGSDAVQPGGPVLRLVTSVYEDGEGVLWAGTLGSGLLRIVDGAVTAYGNRTDADERFSSDLVWGIREDRAGKLWVTTNNAIHIVDRSTGQFERFDIGTHHLTEERNGAMWAGNGRILYEIEPASRRVLRQLTLQTTSNSQAEAILRDRAGRLWVSQAGLFHCDLTKGTCNQYLIPDSLGLSQTPFWSIHEDAAEDGVLWVGTRDGLFRVDTGHGGVVRKLGAGELPGSVVYSILEDGHQRLWMGTSRGLARFDKRTGALRVFDAADGVANTEFNRRAAFASKHGEFFFGGMDGITTFFPDEIRDNPYAPPVVITHVQKSSRKGAIVLNPGETARDGLVLEPAEHEFTFEFAALNFTSPGMNRYVYMLEGFDHDWVQSGTRRFARYVGVPPGSYRFRVRGSNNDGLWNEEGAAMAVTVLPSLWQTVWFRLLGTVAVIALLFGAHRYRVNRLLEVERLRFRIASDLHDDVGSKLSSVALIGEMVTQRAALPDRERRQLTEMTFVARQMVDDLRDIVWMVNPRCDSLDNLVSKMQQTADTMLNGTKHTFHIPPEGFTDGLDMERRRHLFLMYKEALHNVLRHARSSHVEIRLDKQNGMLTLDVCDDGAGFDPASVIPGNGLKNLHERAHLIGGSVTVTSRPGEGTVVRIAARIP